MFTIEHRDILQLVFDYLSQKDLIQCLLVDRLFYQQIMIYIDNNSFTEDYMDNTSIGVYDRLISFYKRTWYDLRYLEYTCNIGNYRMTKHVLDYGAFDGEYDRKDWQIINLFKYACQGGNMKIVELIYNMLEDRNIKIDSRQTALALTAACYNKHQYVVDFLVIVLDASGCHLHNHYTLHPINSCYNIFHDTNHKASY